MALTTCPDCGKQISDAAPACPGCGRPHGRQATGAPARREGTSFAGWGCLTIIVLGVFGVLTVTSRIRDRIQSPPPAASPLAAGSTQKPQPTPTDPRGRLEAAVRKVAEGVYVEPAKGGWLVQWAIPESLTSASIKRLARRGMVDVLKAVKDSGVPFETVIIEGTFEVADNFANKKRQVVTSATFSKATVAKLNWAREWALPETIYEIADRREINSTFR